MKNSQVVRKKQLHMMLKQSFLFFFPEAITWNMFKNKSTTLLVYVFKVLFLYLLMEYCGTFTTKPYAKKSCFNTKMERSWFNLVGRTSWCLLHLTESQKKKRAPEPFSWKVFWFKPIIKDVHAMHRTSLNSSVHFILSILNLNSLEAK